MRYVLIANPRSGTHYFKLLLSHFIGAEPLEARLSRNPAMGGVRNDDLDRALDEEAPHRLVYDHFYFSADKDSIDPARYPDLRLIVLNRHPLDRWISCFAYQRWKGWLPGDRSCYREMARAFVLSRPDNRPLSVLNYNQLLVDEMHNYALDWLRNRPCLYVRYEDLISNPVETLKTASAHFGLSPSEAAIEDALDKYRFEKLSGGRKPGEIDERAHYRNGVAGEWRKLFTDKDVDRLRELYSTAFEAAGYPI